MGKVSVTCVCSLSLGHFCFCHWANWRVSWKNFSLSCRLQPRTEALLGTLVSKRVDCRDALLSVWKTEDKCEDLMCLAWLKSDWLALLSFNLTVLLCFFSAAVLLSAYCQWLPEAMHQEVAKSWPPIWWIASEKKAEYTVTHFTEDLCQSVDLYHPPLHHQGVYLDRQTYKMLSESATTLPQHCLFSVLYFIFFVYDLYSFYQPENISTGALYLHLTCYLCPAVSNERLIWSS